MTIAERQAGAGPELNIAVVTKRFGGLVAASNVSFSIRGGRIHGLIGPNGAGKSTMISLISGVLHPDSGQITFAGRDLTRLDPASVARLGVARTFQQAAPLLGLSVIENANAGMHLHYRSGIASVVFRLPHMRREARAFAAASMELLERVGLAGEAEARAGTLTFGKLRFLEIARAMAMRPRIMLLDEPAAGLNQSESERLAGILRGLRDEGIGLLLVDHDVPFVFDLCDEVTVMDSGNVIAAGDLDSVYVNPVVREAYLGSPDAAAEAASWV
jgi:branched-chain amino acid transport system ATP-binding protein